MHRKKNMKNLNNFLKKSKHQRQKKNLYRRKMKVQKSKITKVMTLEKGQKTNHLTTKRRNRQTKKNLMINRNQMLNLNLKKNQKHPLLRSEEHTSELQSRFDLVCRLLREKKKEKQ